MSKKDIIAEFDIVYNGQTVTVKKFKPKEKRTNYNGARRVSVCPICMSLLKVNAAGLWECTGDRLKIWETEFEKYSAMSDLDKIDYLKNMSVDNMFLELYDKWAYAKAENKPEEYNCGYTNKIVLPIGTNRVKIPDPVRVKFIETSLKRKLTEEELYGEDELWIFRGQVSKNYKKGSKKVTISIITLPDDV